MYICILCVYICMCVYRETLTERQGEQEGDRERERERENRANVASINIWQNMDKKNPGFVYTILATYL